MIVRKPAVAGTLYDADSGRLFAQLETWMEQGTSKPIPKQPKGLVVPHSGYVYSGKLAAEAFRTLIPYYDGIKRVVLLGRSHRERFQGIALPGADAFKTPIGAVKIDPHATQKLALFDQVFESPELHELEHSLEVQLPFLQTALDSFTLVAMMVGNVDPGYLADLLEPYWASDDTLIVVSTDLSRGLSAVEANEKDQRTSERIRFMDDQLTSEDACAFSALNGFLHLARLKGADSKRMGFGHSGQSVGRKDKVIGYGSFVFY